MRPLILSKTTTRALRLVHRNGGVVLAVFLLLLAVTGVMLNHTEDLALDDRRVPGMLASRYYEAESISGFVVAGHYVYRVADTLFLDQIAVGICPGDLVGAVAVDQDIVTLCGDELLIVSAAGVLVERVGAAHGLPPNVSGIAGADRRVVLRTPTGITAFDPLTLEAEVIDQDVRFPEPVTVPDQVMLAEVVTWEQFILDLHSGRFLGKGGVWLADFIAVLLVLLALTGIVMWLLPRPDNGSKS